MEQTSKIIATGRRKNAAARVNVLPGSGQVFVNNRSFDEFFGGLKRHKKEALKPLAFLQSFKNYDYQILVAGGGITGQAGAIRHSLARAILKIEPALRKSLKKAKLLTRDPRMVERKKSGQPKARKRFQFSKR